MDGKHVGIQLLERDNAECHVRKHFLEKKSRRHDSDMIEYFYLNILGSTPDELLRTHSEIH